MNVAYYHSPLGFLEISASDEGLTSVTFVESKKENEKNIFLDEGIEQLNEYFHGARKNFSVPIAPQGTEFQKNVWDKLVKIPFGKTVSYLDVARALNNESAARAVGAANGKNPIAIIVPCHRVVGADGSLTGYAGGMWRKERLLRHERKISGEGQINIFS